MALVDSHAALLAAYEACGEAIGKATGAIEAAERALSLLIDVGGDIDSLTEARGNLATGNGQLEGGARTILIAQQHIEDYIARMS